MPLKDQKIFTLLCKRCTIKKQRYKRDDINTSNPRTIVKLCKRCTEKMEERNKLAEENRNLIGAFLRKFYCIYPKARHHYPADDAFNDGYEGLLRACELFDERIAKFSTYAFWWIRQAVMRAWIERDEMVRIPPHAFNKVRIKGKQIEGELFEKIVADEEYHDVETREVIDRVRWALSKIHRREADVVQMRMAGMKLEEIAVLMGVTRERVRQLEARGKHQLRKLLGESARDLCEA